MANSRIGDEERKAVNGLQLLELSKAHLIPWGGKTPYGPFVTVYFPI